MSFRLKGEIFLRSLASARDDGHWPVTFENNQGHVYGFLNFPSSFLVDFACDAVGPLYYCVFRRPLPVEELFIHTDPEDGGDVDHV